MLNKMFSNVFFNALLFILGITFISLFIQNTIIFVILSLICIYFFISKVKIKRFGLFLFLYSFIIRLIAIFILKTPIESDFKVLYDASVNLLNGDFSFNKLTYFRLWGYQIGQVVYQTILLKLWNNVLILKIVNSLISSGTIVLVYLLGKELFKEKTAKAISLLYSLFLFPLLFNAVLSNQILSTFLTYCGIYILFAKRFDKLNKWVRYPLVGVLLGIANVIRPEGIVILTTIIVFFILTLTKKTIKECIQKNILIFVGYYVMIAISSFVLIVTNISPVGLSNEDPLWKFVLGFNHETVGMYSTNDEYAVGNREVELKLIKQRTIDSLDKIPILFVKKIRNFWFSSDIYWSNNYLDDENINVLGLTLRDVVLMKFLTIIISIYIILCICVYS